MSLQSALTPVTVYTPTVVINASSIVTALAPVFIVNSVIPEIYFNFTANAASVATSPLLTIPHPRLAALPAAIDIVAKRFTSTTDYIGDDVILRLTPTGNLLNPAGTTAGHRFIGSFKLPQLV